MQHQTAEARRLAALRELCILDTVSEPHLDAVCRTAAALFDVPLAMAPLVDESRLWFKARHGVEATEIARPGAFCDVTIRGLAGEALVARDLLTDERFAYSPLVTGAPHARFYAGVPIAASTGENIGTLCIVDTIARPEFSDAQARQLEDLARIVEAHLRLHEAQQSVAAQLAERREVEARLAERENRLAAAKESQSIAEQTARIGHWRIDGATRTIEWSDGIARIFGRNAELKRLPLEEHFAFYHPDDRARVLDAMETAARGESALEGGGYRHQSKIVRPDGEERFVSVHGVAERDADGAVKALHGVCVDVTDVALSEEQARMSGEILRTTLENLDQGLLMIGPDRRVKLHNERLRRLLDLPETVLFDGALFDDVREHQMLAGEFGDSPPEVVDTLRHGFMRRQPITVEHRRPNGAILEIRSFPLADGGVVRTTTDVTLRHAGARAVKESERRFRLLAESTSDVIIWSDLDTTRRYVSPAVKKMLGYAVEHWIGTQPLDFVHPDDVAPYREALQRLTSGAVDSFTTSKRYRHANGSWIWVEVSFNLTKDLEGRPIGYVASLRDVTGRKHAEEALRVSEERLALAIDSGSDGLWDWDVETGEMRLSDHWYGMLGYDPGELPMRVETWNALVHPEDVDHSKDILLKHLKGQTPAIACEYRMLRKDGGYAWTLARGKVVSREADGRATRVVGTHIDITGRKQAERQVAYLAMHDALTGLPNRTLFRDRLNQVITATGKRRKGFAVLACDLDRFKSVNDSRGHVAGDALLRTVAERLSSVVRPGDTVARLGGDEFAVILNRIDGPQTANLMAQRIIAAVGEPIDLDGQTVGVGVSIGISVGPRDGLDADQLFKNADIALYRAKAAGRNTHRFYEPRMDAHIEARNLIELDLRAAVARGGLSLSYQPIMGLEAGEPNSFEALLRWSHPTRGEIAPSEFIPIAEESGLILPLGEWALREACREAASWPSDLRVSVNVSAVQFQRPGLEQTVVSALSASGLAPERLELEITESVLMQDAEAVVATLLRLRGLGVRIALDDFGTGYSSLSYLRRFPFDKIKIDRSFIREIADPDASAIVHAIVGLAARSGAAITAEGIETKRQLDIVRRLGCTEGQGYLFSKPLPPREAVRFLARFSPQRSAVA